MLDFFRKHTPRRIFSLYHFSLAWLGNTLYRFPGKKLFLIGVTGTKGKTTTAYFIYQLLEMAGRKTALTSTVFFALGDKITKNYTKMGMPGRFFLPRWLKKATAAGAEYAVVETTSEGIAQHRQRYLDYNVAVFTSLSPEHIERHGSFSAYRQAKEKLFAQTGEAHVVNLDDRHAKDFLKHSAREKWGVVLDGKNVNHPVDKILQGTVLPSGKLTAREWVVRKEKKELISQSEIRLPFPGKFNAMNLLLAIGAARAAGVPFSKIIKNIPQLVLPPGRMQELADFAVPYRIFLDYAHEPLSLWSALEACRELLPAGKNLVCLTGAQGGGRDVWKRKEMGRVAAGLCDRVVVAAEDPYAEDPAKINQAVLDGVLTNKKFQENKNCWQYTDRREAIKKALRLAGAGDIVILCGKGGEQLMCAGNKKIPWNEEEEVKKALN